MSFLAEKKDGSIVHGGNISCISKQDTYSMTIVCWAAPSSGNRLKHLDGLCRAHCTHPSGAIAGVDRQWFSLSKDNQLVQHAVRGSSLSETDSAPHGDRLFHLARWTSFPAWPTFLTQSWRQDVKCVHALISWHVRQGSRDRIKTR